MQNSKVKYNNSQILRNAHALKSAQGLSLSDAMKQAWALAKAVALKETLSMGCVEFTFEKLDGTLRFAVGTMNLELFTPLFKTDRQSNDKELKYNGTVTYWDLEVKEWRCCRIDRIKTIKSVKVIGAVAQNFTTLLKAA